MNELQSVFTSTPNGTDECAQFSIDTISNPFTFHNVTQADVEYMLSFYIKSNSNGSISIAGKTISTTTSWEKHIISYTGSGTDLILTFKSIGTYYIYHTMLEQGNVASDWHLAEEDTEARLDNAESNILQLSESIDLTVKKGSLISQIHVEAGNAKIMAEDIDLEGYVTITDLKNSGETIINGDNITTGVIRSKYTVLVNGEDIPKFYLDLNTGYTRMADGDFTGKITANEGIIGGWNIGDKSLYKNTTSMTSTTAGTYIGTDGIRNYESSSAYINMQNGVLTATGVDLTGKITASSGKIGGFTIDSSSIYTNSLTSTADGSVALSTTSFTRSIDGTSRTNLRFAIGQYFAVDYSGKIYAVDGVFNGTVNATSGKIGGWTIEENRLYNEPNTETCVFIGNATNDNKDFLVVRTGIEDNYEYPFWVRGDGSVYMTKGTVGGFTITEECLSYTTSDTKIELGTSGITVIGGEGEGEAEDYMKGIRFVRNARNGRFTAEIDTLSITDQITGGLTVEENITCNNVFLKGTAIRPKADNTSNVNIGSSTYPFYNLYLSHCVYYTSPPTGSGTAVYINSNGAIVKYSSDRRLKNSINPVTDEMLDPNRLYNLPIYQYKYNQDVMEVGDDLYDKTVIGFMADEVEKVYPAACAHDTDGTPTSWNPNVMIPALLSLVQEQKKEIVKLNEKIENITKYNKQNVS